MAWPAASVMLASFGNSAPLPSYASVSVLPWRSSVPDQHPAARAVLLERQPGTGACGPHEHRVLRLRQRGERAGGRREPTVAVRRVRQGASVGQEHHDAAVVVLLQVRAIGELPAVADRGVLAGLGVVVQREVDRLLAHAGQREDLLCRREVAGRHGYRLGRVAQEPLIAEVAQLLQPGGGRPGRERAEAAEALALERTADRGDDRVDHLRPAVLDDLPVIGVIDEHHEELGVGAGQRRELRVRIDPSAGLLLVDGGRRPARERAHLVGELGAEREVAARDSRERGAASVRQGPPLHALVGVQRQRHGYVGILHLRGAHGLGHRGWECSPGDDDVGRAHRWQLGLDGERDVVLDREPVVRDPVVHAEGEVVVGIEHDLRRRGRGELCGDQAGDEAEQCHDTPAASRSAPARHGDGQAVRRRGGRGRAGASAGAPVAGPRHQSDDQKKGIEGWRADRRDGLGADAPAERCKARDPRGDPAHDLHLHRVVMCEQGSGQCARQRSTDQSSDRASVVVGPGRSQTDRRPAPEAWRASRTPARRARACAARHPAAGV